MIRPLHLYAAPGSLDPSLRKIIDDLHSRIYQLELVVSKWEAAQPQPEKPPPKYPWKKAN